MPKSRHYQPLSILFSVSAVALCSIIAAQQFGPTLTAASTTNTLCGDHTKQGSEECDLGTDNVPRPTSDCSR